MFQNLLNSRRDEWRDWLNKKNLIQDVELELLQIFNKSIPSLSSIMFLVNCNDNKILCTEGGLGKDVIDAPSKIGMLDKQGKLHIDVLKVPHHGIDRNVTMKFSTRYPLILMSYLQIQETIIRHLLH